MSFLHLLSVAMLAPVASAADAVPAEVQQPGTQPGDMSGLESATRCDNCHGGYNTAVEPAYNWRGSMMSQSSRDPLFWAAMTVAEQDFDGAGDLCLRCHVPDGWVSGRSTPTDGSALNENDAHGVSCDLCHSMVEPGGGEHAGHQYGDFLAYDADESYLGSGMYVLFSGGSDKLGPYDDADARHRWMQSDFHRDVDFCGTCHDISNPVVGDLAPGHGTQDGALPVAWSGVAGAAVADKAAFNNPPYAYGVVERTFSEYKASLLSQTLVSDYASLPEELQDGAIARAYDAAVAVGMGGDYADGTPRYFSCQTCHMQPTQGYGANKRGIPFRDDLPLHDLTGANTWTPQAIAYLDGLDSLVPGGGVTALEVAAMDAGVTRATENLQLAAALSVAGDALTVTNLTGHKLISGYPEGRRMWLEVAWYDGDGVELRRDGEYGALPVTIGGVSMEVDTLLDLEDPYLTLFEARYAMTQEWAEVLVDLGLDPDLPLVYDRETGAVDETLGELAAESPGDFEETFHFVLNDYIATDNRIPPYGLDYDEARVRNILPVPAEQYGDPGPGGVYDHQAVVDLSPPEGAVYADIALLFQPTSWEYIQFLYLANDASIAHLASTGDDLLDAWLATGMAAPVTMATAAWGAPPTPSSELDCADGLDDDGDGAIDCDDADCAADAACETPVGCDSDGVCEAGEDCLSCAEDCAGVTGGKKADRYCCGDGALDTPEGDGAICDGNP